MTMVITLFYCRFVGRIAGRIVVGVAAVDTAQTDLTNVEV
jgi:hypothetical protein